MGFKKLLLNSGIYFAALVGVLTMLPLPNKDTFTAYSNTPQKPFTGSLELNEQLSGASKLFENQIKGPEGLLNYKNTLYTTLHYGHVVKIVDNEVIPVVKFGKVCDGLFEEHICGRPLGLNVDKSGVLYVADAYYGIFKVNINSSDQYGAKEQIISMDEEIEGVKPKLPNSVVVASDGAMYWTDSDTNYGLHNGLYTLFTDGTGRLVKYDPKTKKNTVLMNNLHFANGVELSDDESFIIVSETIRYRIHKYYLKGPNAGKSEIFIDGLPGMPDNIKKIGSGIFYIPLVFTRNVVLDKISEYPTIRMVIAKLLGLLDLTFQTIDSFYPNVYFKKAAHWVGHFESVSFMNSIFTPRLTILKVNEKGIILNSWHSTDGKVYGICDVELVNEKIYLGSPFNNYLGVLKAPQRFL